ncbi:ICP0-binding domain of ubiquitin-specific protease 7-domain-containing protein [Jimgerdemannia flammicorona]|uniref:ICP0-binding domain of ubiquitin-specific protease 7-domain-containing protein n=1 Tax=Jimgerdemannia flammicorona TaxID=994334 RepID=A0A433DIG6_9FUNG|nr:ICP0-binding domain of ubiquitin-specific protease 7-domain-containing protein [Jimgerdemannia flammicorona]
MCDNFLQIVTDKIFKVHQGFDLANFDDKTMQSEIPSFRVKEEERFAVFKQSVADHFQVPVNRFRLWILVKRLNRTVRPDQPIPETEANSSMIAINDKMGNQSTLQLYLEEADKPIIGRLWSYQMIFLKYFDPKTQKIEGCGKLYVQPNGNVCDIIPILNEKKGFPSNTKLILFEEVKFSRFDAMKTTTTFQIQNGDIICFQKEISDREVAEYRSQGYVATITEFFEQLFKQRRLE